MMKKIALTQISLSELMACQHSASKLDLRHCAHRLNTISGNTTSHLRGRGVDFVETRCYQSGDDIRCMDWRVTARTGKPHVKLYQTERERPILFATDLSHSLFFGTQVAFKSVIAAKITAMLAWTAVQQGDCTGGIVFNNTMHHCIRPANRKRGVLPLLNALGQATMQKPTTQNNNFNTALSQLVPIARPGSLVFVISDFLNFDEKATHYLSQLRSHSDVICILIYDNIEAQAPPANRYPIYHEKQQTWLNTQSTQTTQRYTDYFDQRVNTVKQQCHTRLIPLLLVNTAKPLLETLLPTFGRYHRQSSILAGGL